MGQTETALRRRRRIGSRLLCLLSVCAVGSAIYAESDPEASVPAYCTVFHHQVKSAGTTVKDKLETASLEAGLPKPGLCVVGKGYEQSCLEAINGSNPVISGYTELVRHPLEDRGRVCEYFTVLRHPIDRLVSAFFYCPPHDPQTRPKKWCGHAEQGADMAEETQRHLLEFALYNWKNKAFRQMTFGTFCPKGSFCKKDKPDPRQNLNEPGTVELLKHVEEVLSTYTAVGILEYWNLSMDLFNARIKSPVRDWKVEATPDHLVHLGMHKANIGTFSELRQQVHQWARTSPEIHAAVATDMLFYDFGLAIFKQQTTDALGTEWD